MQATCLDIFSTVIGRETHDADDQFGISLSRYYAMAQAQRLNFEKTATLLQQGVVADFSGRYASERGKIQ